MVNAIELREITHYFDGKMVLDHISLNVGKGEILGLLGPSGAGKTTLIRILTGQLAQTSGTAYLSGIETGKHAGKTRRNAGGASGRAGAPLTGMMTDDCGLYERFSAYENLHLFARIYNVPRSRIEEILRAVGLWEARNTAVSKLSKGMRQRLSFARAVLAGPQILFLDEPSCGLDPQTAAEIHGLIRQQKQAGVTVFLTTHNMQEATKLCDHTALLNGGVIVEYGPPEEICRRYHHQKKLLLRLSGGENVVLPHTKEAAETVADYLRREQIDTIHSTEPDLETVFMELTGRRIDQ